LPEFLGTGGISYSADEIAKLASCIRNHKGSFTDSHPDGLEAKVVADADQLEKFGALGVHQNIRAWGEFDWPLARVVEFGNGKFLELTLETETGRELAEPARRLVADFFHALKREAGPYGEKPIE
jgi:hypothetical protein